MLPDYDADAVGSRLEEAKHDLIDAAESYLRTVQEAEELEDLRSVRRKLDRETKDMAKRFANSARIAYRHIRGARSLLHGNMEKTEREFEESKKDDAQLNNFFRLMVQKMPRDFVVRAPDYLKEYITSAASGQIKAQGDSYIKIKGIIEQHIGQQALDTKRQTAYVCLREVLSGLLRWTWRYTVRVIIANGSQVVGVALMLGIISRLAIKYLDRILIPDASRSDLSTLLPRDVWDAIHQIHHLAKSILDPGYLTLAIAALFISIGVQICRKLVMGVANKYLLRMRKRVLEDAIFQFAATSMRTEGWIRLTETEMSKSDPLAELNVPA
jgi:hypothetical protein